MLFHTPEFFFLLILTFISYYLFRNARLVLLSIANGLFYAAASWGFLFLFLGVSFASYRIARLIPGKNGRMWTAIGILINAANLLFFKYSLFVLHNIETITGWQLVTPHSFWSSIVLPVGISFYTFQLIAYLVDVRKGLIKPTNSYLHFWVFIAFFAHQLAGPIMRGNEFMPQVEKTRSLHLHPADFKYGVYLIMWGLAKKIMIADKLSPIVQQYFESPASLHAMQAWVGAYLFGFQIYADFSGYSDMAVGLGYLFGYRLPINFRTPYISGNATEFWRRWHITLSSWIRDYIYIPLGGSRKGKIRKDVNLLASMLISGLWHGAMWTFVIWGFLHGVLLIIHKWYITLINKWTSAPTRAQANVSSTSTTKPVAETESRRVSTSGSSSRFEQRSSAVHSIGNDTESEVRIPAKSSIAAQIGKGCYRILAVFIFFQLTTLTWVFFRAKSVADAFLYIRGMLSPASWTGILQQFSGQKSYLLLAACLYAAHWFEYIVRSHENKLGVWWHRFIPSPVRGLLYTLLVLLIIAMIKGEKHEFIYFRF
ncbi:MBOAT family O-acyltransferase [Aneurinibacillus terranovensis]|uniref:MBOAT family O-acyltransferase n=1 Tax=Aneurinibacillus terranovensis TaxID=278991 RepID=UPI000428C2F3|nr:MBOAT family O-acyltransferase [Aneurinibacillus terranovensis]